jgi:hypothetical protein
LTALTPLARADHDGVRRAALGALAAFGEDALKGIRAANGLGGMGAAAKPALPALREAVKKWARFGAFGRAAKPVIGQLEKLP